MRIGTAAVSEVENIGERFLHVLEDSLDVCFTDTQQSPVDAGHNVETLASQVAAATAAALGSDRNFTASEVANAIERSLSSALPNPG